MTSTTDAMMHMPGVSVCTPAYSSWVLSFDHVYTDTASSSSTTPPVSQLGVVLDTTTCSSAPVAVPT